MKDHELDHILSKINGVVFPNGRRRIRVTHKFEQFALNLLKKVKELNEKGVFTPLMGIGQGFELKNALVAETDAIFQRYSGTKNIMLPQLLWKQSKGKGKGIFGLFDKTDLFNFKFRRTTAHFHKLGISPIQYQRNLKLRKFFKVLCYGIDGKGKVFISGVEGKNFPFYGIHFLPHLVPRNRFFGYSLINSNEAIRISQKIGNFFTHEARKNPNFQLKKMNLKN